MVMGTLEILAGSVNSLVSIDVKSSGSSTVDTGVCTVGNVQRTGYYDIAGGSECGVCNWVM